MPTYALPQNVADTLVCCELEISESSRETFVWYYGGAA